MESLTQEIEKLDVKDTCEYCNKPLGVDDIGMHEECSIKYDKWVDHQLEQQWDFHEQYLCNKDKDHQ